MQFNKPILFFAVLCAFSCNTSTESDKLLTLQDSSSLDVPANSLYLDPIKGIHFFGKTPFTGRAIKRYSDSSYAMVVTYSDGKKNGIFQKWYPSGQISYSAEYINGKLSGTSRTWWKNGKLRTESNFVQGIPNGPQYQYYKSGQKFKLQYLNHGIEEGLQRSWRENGALYNNYEAKNGKIYGLKRSKLCFQLDDEEVQL